MKNVSYYGEKKNITLRIFDISSVITKNKEESHDDYRDDEDSDKSGSIRKIVKDLWSKIM